LLKATDRLPLETVREKVGLRLTLAKGRVDPDRVQEISLFTPSAQARRFRVNAEAGEGLHGETVKGISA
jgi:hypothetical protein